MSSVSLLCGILLALPGISVVANLDKTLQYCCALGREAALSATKCEMRVKLPIRNVRSDQQNICSSTISLCCLQFRRDSACNGGKQVAEEGGDCNREIKTDQDISSKYCCEACKLGIESGLLAGSCDFDNTPFSSPWSEAFKSCCMNVTQNRSTLSTPPTSFGRKRTKNRCDEMLNPCQHNCYDNGISVSCSCNEGYELLTDNKSCGDINECQVNSHTCNIGTQRCDNTIGSYHCVRSVGCGTGYTFNSQTGDCEDDNECLLETNNCKSLGSEWECRNTLGSFRCEKKRYCNSPNCTHTPVSPLKVIRSCSRGFQLSKQGACVDIDECKITSTCKAGLKCVNTVGSYFCAPSITCSSGLRVNETTNLCTDIDECEEQLGVCDHKCINLWGTFICSCQPGFSLHEDNRSCIDINECELFKDRRLCVGTCINVPGSYRCHCPDGYQLSQNGRWCQDIDECALESRCNSNEVCLNMRGSYRCNAIECPTNYERDQNKKNRCVRAAYYCGYDLSEECLTTPISYSFNYLNLVSNVTIPTSGYLELFNLRGGSQDGFTTIDLSLKVMNVRTPAGVPRVQDEFFYLHRIAGNSATVTLKKSITGPQDVELHLKMSIYSKGVFVGFNIYKLFIYISPYDF